MVQQKNNAQSTAKYAWYVQQKEINVHVQQNMSDAHSTFYMYGKKPLLNG